jgi:hypothetical protein
VDIRAEEAAFINPYQFGYNNPVMFNDPMGDLSQADWNDFLSRLGNGSNLNGFGEYGGSYSSSGGGGFQAFSSHDQAFGWGVANMNSTGSWGSNSGWAKSFGEALGRYNGGRVTSGMVQGYYQQQWGGTGRENIRANNAHGVHEGQGFNVGWAGNSNNPNNVEVGSMFLSNERAFQLLAGENLGNNSPTDVRGYLVGSYNWQKEGNSYTAQIEGLYVFATNVKGGGYFRLDCQSACVTIPAYDLVGNKAAKMKQADIIFNTAWNSAVRSLDLELNNWYAGSNPILKYPTIQFATPYFLMNLRTNLYGFNSGCAFSYGNGCIGDKYKSKISYAKYRENL